MGDRFQRGTIYIPELMLASRTMEAVIDNFKELLAGSSWKSKGKVVIGTIKGDLHDIGKNLVTMMLEGQGFEVVDLGISVEPETFLEAIKTSKPDILALSALLTTAMVEMKHTIDTIAEAGLRDSVKIIVGGASLTQDFADQIGADAYAYDSPGAVKMCKAFIIGSKGAQEL